VNDQVTANNNPGDFSYLLGGSDLHRHWNIEMSLYTEREQKDLTHYKGISNPCIGRSNTCIC